MYRLTCDSDGFQRIIFTGGCPTHPDDLIKFRAEDGTCICSICGTEIAWQGKSAFSEIVK